jgi:hypothetical protein
MVNYLNTGISGDILTTPTGDLLTDDLGSGTGLTPTTSTLTSSPNPSLVGQNITLTLTVMPSTATGHYSFARDAGVILGDGFLDGVTGVVVLVTSNTGGVGVHDVTANFDGDATYAPSTSNLIVQTVVDAAPVTGTMRYVVFNM